MDLRIQNMESLASHGNIPGRRAMLDILEAGLEASDPYNAVKELIRIDRGMLIIGNREFEPAGTPISGDAVFNLDEINNIYVFGAGKGVQRVAKGIEEVLGDRLTGGHVIDKKGHPVILERVGVTLGGHPVPDEGCVEGCQRIIEMTKDLTENDLVFTCATNGISSLLTMPVPGVSLEDVRRITYVMQLEHGAPTSHLNTIRQHLDMMKGGRISRYIQPARAIHILAIDPGVYEQLMYKNLWLHTLPDYTTFQMAIDNIKKWDAWEEAPKSVVNFLERADPEYETVKAEEFEKKMAPHRIFGIMPARLQTAKLPLGMKKAEGLGFKSVILAERMWWVEPQQAARLISSMARTIEHIGQPLTPPCALFSSGEMTVAIGKERGMGSGPGDVRPRPGDRLQWQRKSTAA